MVASRLPFGSETPDDPFVIGLRGSSTSAPLKQGQFAVGGRRAVVRSGQREPDASLDIGRKVL